MKEARLNQKLHPAGVPTNNTFLKRANAQKYLLLMSVPFVLWAVVFFYVPIWGWLMAFQDFNPAKGILGSPWVGLKHFIRFFGDGDFIMIMRNTLAISFLNCILTNTLPVILALMLNEVRNIFFKRGIQTISYLPHFVSYVIVANIFLTILSPSEGVVNGILLQLGLIDEPFFFFAQPELFWFLVGFINIWKEAGWLAIIYIAAISSIDPQLYEAGTADGAGRFRKIWHITLPSIKPTIVVLLILSIGQMLNSGSLSVSFDPSYLLGNSMTIDYAEVIDTYIYRFGIKMNLYSFATAVGLFRIVIGFVLIVAADKAAKKFFGEEGII